MDWYWIFMAGVAVVLVAPPIIGVTWYESPGLRRFVKRMRRE